MGRSLSHQDIFSAIDRYFDAQRQKVEAELRETEAKRDLAKLAITWLASGDLQAGQLAGVETSGRIETGPAQNTDGLMTLQETAKFLRVTEQTVHAWRKRGIIEGLQYGEEWRFQRDELIRAGRKTQASKKPLRMVS